MPKLPLNLSKAVETWREVSANRDLAANIILAGDPHLVSRAEQQFSLGGTLPATWVRPPRELAEFRSVPGEVLVVFVSAAEESEATAALRRAAPKGGAVIAVDEGAAGTGRTSRPCIRCTRLSFSDSPAGWSRLYRECAEAAGDHAVALARRFPVLRAAAARRVVDRTAGQNGVIGLVFFLPGTDMAAMTLNQIRMMLSIASLYGEEIDQERAVELAGVVGLGFGFRSLARLLVRNLPGVGWVVKAVTGYSATMAMGLAAIKYFEKGAPASTSRVVALAGSLKR